MTKKRVRRLPIWVIGGLLVFLAVALPASGVLRAAAPTVYINEIQVSTTSSDWEFFEIAGAAGTSLSDLTMVSIESDAGSSSAGRIDSIVSLSGTIPADGFWWAGSPAAIAAYGGTPDGAMADNTFENSSTTNLLVYNFTGSVGDDVDTDNDGTLDATFWDSIVDGVAVIDSLSDNTYAGVSGYGPDGTFLPSGLYRCGDAPGGSFSNSQFHNFGSPDGTPGITNATQCVIPPPEAYINEIQVSTTSTDWEFVEIAGASGTDLSSLTLLAIESDIGSSTGRVDRAIALTGTIPGDGFWYASSPAADTAYGGTGDASIANNTFENSSTTYLLTYEFTGLVGDDLDTDDDGTLDTTPWTSIVDSVAIKDSGVGDFAYASAPQYGPDGSFLPSGLYRCGDAPGGNFSNSQFHNFGSPDGSPGASNIAQCSTGWIINEIHADPASGSAGDANGDGVRHFGEDEFVEIVNTTGGDIDISGWTLADGVSVRHTFPGGTTIPDQCGIVVFGGGSPTGTFGDMTVQTASSGQLGLNNSGDLVLLNDGGSDVALANYGSEGGDNQSLTRDPDITGPYVKHSVATGSGGALWSPGTMIDGTAFAGCAPTGPTALYIHQIQGNNGSQLAGGQHDDISPEDGKSVIVQGIVVAEFLPSNELNGFFMQEEDLDADADTSTSEGIFVFCGGSCPAVAVGDQVTVTGAVDEFFGMTQIDNDNGDFNVVIDSSGNALPSAGSIDLPVVGDIDDFYEQYEGMLVNYADVLTVSEYFELNRYGQVVLFEGGRPYQYTHVDDTPTVGEYNAHLDDLNRRRVILDDDDNIQNSTLPNGVIYHPQPDGLSIGTHGTDYFRGADTVTGLTGVMHWSFAGFFGTNAWRVRPVDPAYTTTFTPVTPRPTTAPDTGGNVTVASFNVLNYFTTIDTGASICGPLGNQGCRGADSVDELDRQATKIVAALAEMDADVVGLIEIENSNDVAIADLVNRLNAEVGAGTYDYIPTGYIGSDVITVGIIYKPATVTPAGAVAVLDDPSFTDPNNSGTDKNRPAVAQTFTEVASNSSFTVVVNHLKSKGSSCGAGDDAPNIGAGSCNLTRTLGAQALLNWLATDPTNSLGSLGYTETDVLIIGDLNSYAGEDPIDAIKAAGYADLLGGPGTADYTYLFSGQVGYLDYAMSNGSLTPQVTDAAPWNINADEIPLFDYNNAGR